MTNFKENLLWEEVVSSMKTGYHKMLVEKAYGDFSGDEKVFPIRDNVFAAMKMTSLPDVKAVIIGQDPYFNEHVGVGPEAHGLCFSVKEGIPVPPSLRNIFKEVERSVYKGEKKEQKSDLTRWAKQGVLLLNSSLTVIKKKPNSHASLGWHKLTDDVIKTVSENKKHVVFMLWGAFAQKKASLIDLKKHYVLTTSHPSPLSAYRGFLGSNVFIKCNEYLTKQGQNKINW